jgi:5-methylcytosine-specific restriction endonuclease McrA
VLYCSKSCKSKSQPKHRKHKRELTRNPAKARRQLAFLRRRDGDNCWLCLRPIDFTITADDDPMHYSRDHVVPRALGGDLGVANMRLAHRRCNAGRDLGLLIAQGGPG